MIRENDKELREADKPINKKLLYAMQHFYDYTLDFKRELKMLALKELSEKEVNEIMAEGLIDFFTGDFMQAHQYYQNYGLLEDIKNGVFNEFICVEQDSPPKD